jgi:hypothetical protein
MEIAQFKLNFVNLEETIHICWSAPSPNIFSFNIEYGWKFNDGHRRLQRRQFSLYSQILHFAHLELLVFLRVANFVCTALFWIGNAWRTSGSLLLFTRRFPLISILELIWLEHSFLKCNKYLLTVFKMCNITNLQGSTATECFTGSGAQFDSTWSEYKEVVALERPLEWITGCYLHTPARGGPVV